MRNSIRKLAMVAGTISMALMALAIPNSAQAQYTNVYSAIIARTVPNVPLQVLGSTTSNITAYASNSIPIRPGTGLGLFAGGVFTNAGTEAVTFKFDVTYDGVNFTTTQPLSYAFAGNGTTAVLAWTNLPPILLDNVKAVVLTGVVNAHASSVTNLSLTTCLGNWPQGGQRF